LFESLGPGGATVGIFGSEGLGLELPQPLKKIIMTTDNIGMKLFITHLPSIISTQSLNSK